MADIFLGNIQFSQNTHSPLGAKTILSRNGGGVLNGPFKSLAVSSAPKTSAFFG
jgi:hypothetical protein